jgi:hypothetical protein
MPTMCDYFAPDSWYEPDYYYEPECSGCEEKEKATQVAREYLEELITILYSEEKLDTAKLDDILGELAHQFDCKVPAHLPRVSREDGISKWINFNNQYLKQLA